MSSSSDPEFTPILIGMPRALAAPRTSWILSRLPMFPGLRRTFATPASMAFRANTWLKWMSATTGIDDRRTISFIASAASLSFTVTRTISHPASAAADIWATVASTSPVLHLVIV